MPCFIHGFNRADEIVFGGIFQQVGPRAGLKRLQDVALIGMHAKKNDGGPRQLRRNLSCGLDAVQNGHRHIHDHDVGLMLLGHRDRFAAV